MNNTIRLLEGYEKLTKKEYKHFSKGDTIWGADSNAKELKRWSIDQKDEAMKELGNYKCEYDEGNDIDITEYALEFFESDEEGEFVRGSDFELADEKFESYVIMVNGVLKQIEIGKEYDLEELYDVMDDEPEELIRSKEISPDGDKIFGIEIVREEEEPLKSRVRIKGLLK